MEHTNKPRLLWVDMLRILATWGVIRIHDKRIPEDWCKRYIECCFWGNCFTWCVPVFLMLSGMLVLRKEPSVKDVLIRKVPRVILMKVVSIVLCFSAILILDAFQRNKFSIDFMKSEFWRSFGFGFGTSFLSVLLGCYLVSPFLYKICQDEILERYFILLSIAVCFVMPAFVDIESVKNAFPHLNKIMVWFDFGQIYIPAGSTIYFVLGHYFYTKIEKISKRQACLMLVVSLLLWQGLNFYLPFKSPKFVFIPDFLRYGRHYGTYVSPLIMYLSVSVFIFFMVMFKDMKVPMKIEKLILHLGRNSIMIFLLHGIMICIIKPMIPWNWAFCSTIEILVETTMYFVLGYVISLLLEKIPVVKRILG